MSSSLYLKATSAIIATQLALGAPQACQAMANEEINPTQIAVSPEVRAVVDQKMEELTVELKDMMAKLAPRINEAKSEAEKNRYIQGTQLAVANFIYRAKKLDLQSAVKAQSAIEGLEATYPVAGAVAKVGHPMIVGAIATTTAIGTAKSLIVGPFKAVWSATTSHFGRSDIGLIGKLIRSPIIVPKTLGNLLTLGAAVTADVALVYFAGIHVYGAVMSEAAVQKLIERTDADIERTGAELAALDLF